MMDIKVIELNTAVVGSGAAGFNAAVRLKQLGVDSVAIITEGIDIGTSRNTGSDKQTYYKLSLAGETADSVYAMAKDLFDSGAVDGDTALCEAALSVRSFIHLCDIGVPFPTNRYGEYVGYKTDHDPRARATSVGPLTSRVMTESLQREAASSGVQIHDNTLVVSVIKQHQRAVGLLAFNTEQNAFVLYNCRNIIFATGGPGGIYRDSVYPECHSGANGVLFECGALGQNLTEWQYGLASLSPRWNVSGTYMQVLPRFVSVDKDGVEREFLKEYFDSVSDCLSMVFLKGYQWPFDSKKVLDGSSVIDLLVYKERVIRGRRVFLDYRSNPFSDTVRFDLLSDEAKSYLENAGACFGTPIERLARMNAPAIELYKQKGIDLYTDMLEIALCAQHNNGGIAVDKWWQSSVENLFVCGEAAGTHGVYRPGGSALNSGQVGSLRAAQYIARKGVGEPLPASEFSEAAAPYVSKHLSLFESFNANRGGAVSMLRNARARMSDVGGAIRSKDGIEKAIAQTKRDLFALETEIGADGGIAHAYRLRDTLISQITYLCAMKDYIDSGFLTRGSALYYAQNGLLRDGLDEEFRFALQQKPSAVILHTRYNDGDCECSRRPVRPIPKVDGFFENVWRDFRNNDMF